MNTLAKLIAAIAALITSLAFAFIAKDGVIVHHKGVDEIVLSGSAVYPVRVLHE